MYDPLTNPPMPEWNALTNDERMSLDSTWGMYSCPHSCGGDVIYVYAAIRELLRKREQRYFKATMEGPPA